jgi:hypothetical protein
MQFFYFLSFFKNYFYSKKKRKNISLWPLLRLGQISNKKTQNNIPRGKKKVQKALNFWRISGGFDQLKMADFYIRSGGFEKNYLATLLYDSVIRDFQDFFSRLQSVH